MWHRAARGLSLLALAAGIGVGAYTYYGPTGMMCTITSGSTAGIPSPAAPRQEECRTTRMADTDRDGRAIAFLSVWSLAPALALLGTFLTQRVAVVLASVALFIEFLAILGAMSVGFLYFFLVLPLTGLALFATVMPRRSAG